MLKHLKLNFLKKWLCNAIMMSIVFQLLSFVSLSQSIKNIEAKVLDDVIVVTYDLNGDKKDEFNVNLYSSKDNFETPLTLVTGDVGQNITPGKGKRIEWLAKNELGNFEGNLIFELRAFLPEPAFDPLELVNFNIDEIKSGKSYSIQWKGGKPNERIDILLYEDEKQKSRIAQVDNSGKYLFKIPKGNKNSNYRIQLDGESGIVGSSQFKIKPSFPLFLVIGSGVVVAGTITTLLLLNGDDAPEQTNNLPEPPNPE